MKKLGAIAVLLCLVCASMPAMAQEMQFQVLREDAVGELPSDLRLGRVETKWLPDGALEIVAWDSESCDYDVVDGSGELDVSIPQVIRLSYRVHQPPPPGFEAPVVFCESVVKLRFVVRGIPRTEYQVYVEHSMVLRSPGFVEK
jgi:hypothetical protein